MNAMQKIILSISSLFLLLGFNSCKTNLETRDVTAGQANFTRYVAIGNSLTSGFADGALYREGQENSFTNMLAKQFQLAGGGAFKIPYMNEGGGNDLSGNPRRVLGYVIPCGSTTPSLTPVWDPAGATPLNNVAAMGPYNMVGVPGARAIDVNSGVYSSSFGNAFLTRFCLNPGVSSMTSEALRINPTFFTLWLGSNDVLLYALGGAVEGVGPFAPALSDTSAVRVSLEKVVDTLTKHGAKGAIANVPDMTSIPYFTTIPWNSVVLTASEAAQLNAIYAPLGITWQAGANGFMIADTTAPASMRHATAEDLILLTTPSDSIRCGKWGVDPTKPLQDQYVLDKAEIELIQWHTNSYNQSIANLAASYHLAHVDMNRFLKSFKSGIVYNGIALNANYVSGGAFSLDGVHPNPRGYALIANEFIRTINNYFGSTLPELDVTQYKGIVFP